MSHLVPESFSALVSGREPGPYICGDAWLTLLPGLVEESLARYERSLDEGAAKVTARLNAGDKLRMMWVSGPSSSGKTASSGKRKMASCKTARALAKSPLASSAFA